MKGDNLSVIDWAQLRWGETSCFPFIKICKVQKLQTVIKGPTGWNQSKQYPTSRLPVSILINSHSTVIAEMSHLLKMTFNFLGETKFEVFAHFCTNVSNSKAVCLIEDFSLFLMFYSKLPPKPNISEPPEAHNTRTGNSLLLRWPYPLASNGMRSRKADKSEMLEMTRTCQLNDEDKTRNQNTFSNLSGWLGFQERQRVCEW